MDDDDMDEEEGNEFGTIFLGTGEVRQLGNKERGETST